MHMGLVHALAFQDRTQNPNVTGCHITNIGITSVIGGSIRFEFTHPEEYIIAHKGKFMQRVTDTLEITQLVFNKPAANIKHTKTNLLLRSLSTTALVFTTYNCY